jgi:hypothetical protein
VRLALRELARQGLRDLPVLIQGVLGKGRHIAARFGVSEKL